MRTLDLPPVKRRLLTELLKETPRKMIARQLAVSEASLYQHIKLLRRNLAGDDPQDSVGTD